MSAVVAVQEAVGPDADIVALAANGYVHLLSTDEHSNQSGTGYQAGVLTPHSPYSCERWIRLAFTGTFATVRSIKFWADNLVVPAGWQVRFGVSADYQPPSRDASSIATLAVPTNHPSGPNVSDLLLTGSGTYSPWVVIQAHVTDFGAVQPGSLLGQTGTGVIVPTMIHYHFGWNES